MTDQTLTFVPLPNGIGPNNQLRLSVFLTPRLSGAGTLGAYPDLQRWTELVARRGLSFVVACGGSTETVAVQVKSLRPDVWSHLFTAQTLVEPHVVGDYANRLLVSYPVRDAFAFVKHGYQMVGSGALAATNERFLHDLLEQLVFRDGKDSTLDTTLAQLRVTMWQQQRGWLDDTVGVIGQRALTAVAALPPDGVPTTLTTPPGTRDMIGRFALFHHMPSAPNRPPLPKTPSDFAKTLDFHRALTALGSYPSLLRALGLVFDVLIPASLCPASPTAGTYSTLAIQEVVPGFQWSQAPRHCLPAVAYVRSANAFAAAPATPAASVNSANIVPGDVVEGVVALTPSDFHLVQVDLDGALLKVMTLADNAANSRNPSAVGNSLPSLRSTGIALVSNQRTLQLLAALTSNAGFDQALASGTALPRPLTAMDVMRGYRIDVWSSQSAKWHSLHARNATYRFSNTLVLNVSGEEGFLQTSATHAADDPTRQPDPVSTTNNIPQPDTDLYIHERLANWSGWSLSAKRPGGELNRSPDPAQATSVDPTMNQPLTPFKMTTAFAVPQGSLPELRFGRRYRVRARAVDLAGNSIPLSSATRDALVTPPGGASLTYARFEPVLPPQVVLQQLPAKGGSLERLVIRSYNRTEALDQVASTEVDVRHIAPPRTSVEMAEHHGLLDDANGHLRGDSSTYQMIVARDRSVIPNSGGVPLEPGNQLAVSYLPDPIAAGAALRNLPGTTDNADGHIKGSGLSYDLVPGVQPRPGSVTFIDFGRQWPARAAFRLVLVEGNASPSWDAAARVLKVSLPKGVSTEIDLSSYLADQDIQLMGVWRWLQELFDALETSAMQSASAGSAVPLVGDIVGLLTRHVAEGGHEMITPSRTLTLVHAVQQPLGRPTFAQLPVIHSPAQPILASALRNSFTPITAWRTHGSHIAVLLGGLRIHAASTAQIDLEGSWREVQDDVSLPRPTAPIHSDQLETIKLHSLQGGVIYSDASQSRALATYIPKVDLLWFSAPFDDLQGVTTPSVIAAPRHHFADTKHRRVAYRAVASSRFEECFDTPGLSFIRTGPSLEVDVPSSARPASPEVAYVIPTFGWENEQTDHVTSSVRFGGGLRVYLNRPWYSSGVDELLGVTLWPASSPNPDYATREQFKPYFTQWGSDPIWASGDLSPVPTSSDFPEAVATASQLSLDHTSLLVDVAAHTVHFDDARKLWFADVQFSPQLAYAPFVRLALARYQAHSIQGVELSGVVLADFAQLAPARSAVLMIDPSDARRARLYVGGIAPQGPTQSTIAVNVERRRTDIQTDMGWEPAPTNIVTVTEDAPAPAQPTSVLWAGTVVFQHVPATGSFRVVVREYESIEVDSPSGQPQPGQRLVYAVRLAYGPTTIRG